MMDSLAVKVQTISDDMRQQADRIAKVVLVGLP